MEEKIIEMIEKKGLTVDCFDEMDEMIEVYQEYVRKMSILQKKLEDKVKTVLPEEKFISTYLPVTNYDLKDMKSYSEKLKDKCLWSIFTVIQTKFPKIQVNRVENGDIFNARKVMFDTLEQNADEEIICLEQIQENIKRFLPKNEIVYTGKKSIEFKVNVSRWDNRVRDIPHVDELATVIFDNVKPTETEGISSADPGVKKYRSHFEAMFYKNGKMTVKFDTEEECKRFAEAIFEDPKTILVKIGA